MLANSVFMDETASMVEMPALESDRNPRGNCFASNPLPSPWIPVALSFIGAIFYWLALPPCHQPWAAWVAAFFWSAAVYCPVEMKKRHYFAIYFVGCALWLALLQGIRLAYWPLYGGWVALSLYVAAYLPCFIATARRLRKQFGFALPIACAVSWTGWELVRSYFATGFSACMLGHSLTPWFSFLSLASHFGMFGVSFLVMLSGASFCSCVATYCERKCEIKPPRPRGETGLQWIALGVSMVWIVWSGWGAWGATSGVDDDSKNALGRFLIVQHNMPTMFEADLEGLKVSWAEYARATRLALREEENANVDVVIWPESAFDDGVMPSWVWFDWDENSSLDPEWQIQSDDLFQFLKQRLQAKWNRLTPEYPHPVAYLVGSGIAQLRDGKFNRYNAAVWLKADDPTDPVPRVQYYAKRHLVMFGEYIPIVSSFPDLLARFGLGTLSAGTEFVIWRTSQGTKLAPSVCFENVVPQLIQRQVYELTARGESPDVLVNITNDGWFRGSSILGHHLNNAIGCAVENRRPMLVAANSGYSAWIDSRGRVIKSLGAYEAGTILAEPLKDNRWGLWQSIGDRPARGVAFVALLPWMVSLIGGTKRRFSRK